MDRTKENRGCTLERNASGLYDLEISGNSGTPILDVKNVPFLTAIYLIEKHFGGERS